MTAEPTLEQILSARENRSVRQQQLLQEFNGTLICFTMNIAGPIKLTPAISRAFSYGCRQVAEAFPQEAFLHQDAPPTLFFHHPRRP